MTDIEIPDIGDEPIADVVSRVVSAYADMVEGRPNAVGFLVGKVMKETFGTADPVEAQKEVRKQLDAR